MHSTVVGDDNCDVDDDDATDAERWRLMDWQQVTHDRATSARSARRTPGAGSVCGHQRFRCTCVQQVEQRELTCPICRS